MKRLIILVVALACLVGVGAAAPEGGQLEPTQEQNTSQMNHTSELDNIEVYSYFGSGDTDIKQSFYNRTVDEGVVTEFTLDPEDVGSRFVYLNHLDKDVDYLEVISNQSGTMEREGIAVSWGQEYWYHNGTQRSGSFAIDISEPTKFRVVAYDQSPVRCLTGSTGVTFDYIYPDNETQFLNCVEAAPNGTTEIKPGLSYGESGIEVEYPGGVPPYQMNASQWDQMTLVHRNSSNPNVVNDMTYESIRFNKSDSLSYVDYWYNTTGQIVYNNSTGELTINNRSYPTGNISEVEYGLDDYFEYAVGYTSVKVENVGFAANTYFTFEDEMMQRPQQWWSSNYWVSGDRVVVARGSYVLTMNATEIYAALDNDTREVDWSELESTAYPYPEGGESVNVSVGQGEQVTIHHDHVWVPEGHAIVYGTAGRAILPSFAPESPSEDLQADVAVIYEGIETESTTFGFISGYNGSVENASKIAGVSIVAQQNNVTYNFSSVNRSNSTIADFVMQKDSGTVRLEIEGLVPNSTYTITQDGAVWRNVTTDEDGVLVFNKTGNWSKHEYKITGEPSGTFSPAVVGGEDDDLIAGAGGGQSMILVALGIGLSALIGVLVFLWRRDELEF
jgi:hypothetical protein